MKNVKIAAGLAALFLALAMAMAVYAQGPGDERPDEGGNVGGLGLADPPPAGFNVLYTFTGVRNDTTPPVTAATSIHCTNHDSNPVSVRVEVFNFNNTATMTGNFTLTPSRTATFSSQFTALYFDDTVLAPASAIDQGSGRVLVNGSSVKIICTAQVLDPTNDPPNYGVKLTLYDSTGNLVVRTLKTFLPIILKQ
jgi:hypothetical protein